MDYARAVLGTPYRPWQEWAVIHAGELLPDGRPRFNFVLILVARQNGKTGIPTRLIPFWLTEEMPALDGYVFPPVIIGTSTKLDYAKETWEQVLTLFERQEHLAEMIPSVGVRRSNGETELRTVEDCRYKVAAQNDDAGRSLTVFRGVLDELRQMERWDAHDALVNAANAVPEAQIWGLSNQGDERAVVLDELRDSALLYINSKGQQGDMRLGLFEWSAPPGADPTDPLALAAANPDLGGSVLLDSLMGRAMRAKAAGGEQLNRFKIEVMCMRVRKVDPAVPPEHWENCKDETLDPEDMTEHRGKVATCLDVSMDGLHASLVAAAEMDDGRVRLAVVKAWDGPKATAELKRDLPGLLRTVKPRTLVWFPSGPAAAITAELSKPKGGKPSQIPRSVVVEEVRGEATAVCMGLAELAKSGQIVQTGDAMLEAHVTGAERLWQGDAWRFTRRGSGHCDGAYASAGAAHSARTLPPLPARPRLVAARPRSERESR